MGLPEVRVFCIICKLLNEIGTGKTLCSLQMLSLLNNLIITLNQSKF